MFRRQKSRKESISILRRAIPRISYRPELLERRTMLSTFTSIGQQGNFDYYTSQGTVDEISYNDVDFEAVGIHVDPTTGMARLGDLVQAQYPTEPPVGANLYYIYVTESNPDSYISIYQLNGFGTDPTPAPFDGTSPSIAASNAQTGAQYNTAVPADTGGVLIGDVNPLSVPVNEPYSGLALTGGLGLVPDPGPNGLNPGIDVIPINAATGAPNNFGNFLIGGTLTGTASFGGNLNEFYAGAVLTGDIGGDPIAPQGAPTSARTDPNNFTVAGDLREFITNGPVGTDGTEETAGDPSTLNYITSFDLNVGGKIGEIHIGNSEAGTTGTFAGTIEAGNSPLISGQTAYNTSSAANLTGIWTQQLEVENLAEPNPDQVFTQGQIDLRNDTAADAQILGSVPVLNPTSGLPEKDASGNIIYHASVKGDLDVANGDAADFYGVAVEAGKTFTFQVSAGTVEVFDPVGRLIASNSRSGTGPQQITANRPGIYIFAVVPGGGPYTLTVTNVGNMAIGGIVTTGDYGDIGVNDGLIAGNGDLGALDVGGTYVSTTIGPTPAPADPLAPTGTSVPVTANTSILVADGDLRALVGASIGTQVGTALPTGGPWLSVPNGSVGLIESTTGVLGVNCQFDPNYQNLATPQFVTDDAYASAIGGSIQAIDAATTFGGDIATNAGIGSILAGNMATDTASFIDVNADNKGNDGIIDLIDVSGNFGDAAGGGPGFVTHDGGDIRYMLVGVNGAEVFRDKYFGGGIDNAVTYPAGQTVKFTDQTGNVLTIVPIGPDTTTTTTITNTPANTSTGVTTTKSTTVVTGAQIITAGYQIRDKGGQVPIEILSTGSMSITSAGTGSNAQVNVAFVGIEGTGPAIENQGLDQFGNTTISMAAPVFTAATNDGTTTTTTTNADGSTTTTVTTISGGGTTTNLSLQLMGSARINVLDVQALTEGAAALSNANLIENNTAGEIATINAANLGQVLTHGNLGYTTSVATPASIVPLSFILAPDEAAYPFVDQTTGIDITGDAVDIDAYGGIGNVDVPGTLQSLIANFAQSTGITGAQPIAGQFDGIVGPVVAGTLLGIDIGQGVLPTGTGNVGFSGIFATNTIGLIDNFGNPGADIRGNIVSEDQANLTADVYAPGLAIGQIFLKNGSIIDSNVDVVDTTTGDTFANTSDLGGGFATPEPNELPFASPYIYEIGSVVTTGTGGIIGSSFNATNVGPITVTGNGFGFIDSAIFSQDIGRDAGITASGYGIRDSTVTSGGYLGPVVATGSGALMSVLKFPIDVRQSDLPGFLDPYFGFTPNVNTDLNAVLGTSLQTPNIANVTDTGVVQDDVFKGQESFAGLVAQKIRTAEPLYTAGVLLPTPTVPNVPVIGVDFPMEINFATSVGNIRVYQQLDGLQITTGTLVGLNSNVSVNRLGISVAGELDGLVVHGNLGNFITDRATDTLIPDSYINAGGTSGTIGILRVLGNLSANISATGVIQSVTVTGDLLGSLTAEGDSTGLTLGSLHVFGGVRDNSLVLDGSVGSIIVNGSLGTAAGKLNIDGSANLISVGANPKQKGSTLGLALSVLGTLKTLRVHGTITGPVTTGGDLDNLIVSGDGTTANVVDTAISVSGRLYTASISNGNVAANITANGFINSFTINHGSLLYGNALQSVLDAIHSFTITGGSAYGMYGSLLATNGTGVNFNISGNIGDGTDPAVVSAYSGTNFRVQGTIEGQSTISVQAQLNLLQVGGDIKSGAVISAHPLVTQKITGTNDGSITIV